MKREKFYIEIIDKNGDLVTHLNNEIFIGSKSGSIKRARELVAIECKSGRTVIHGKYIIWTLEELRRYAERISWVPYYKQVVKQMEEM